MSRPVRSLVWVSTIVGVLAMVMCAAATASAAAPQIGSLSTYVEESLVYLVVPYSDPDGDATGFGFRGIKGSGWAEESHPFSNPSYGRVTPGQVAYPFNHACGSGSGLQSDVAFWIYDAAGVKTLFHAHLSCEVLQFGPPTAVCVTSGSTCEPTAGGGAGDGGQADEVAVINAAHPFGGPQVRPRSLAIDNHNSLVGLRWRNWGAPTATASGRAQIVTCDPNCAEGSTETFRVHVRANRIRRCTVTSLDPPETARFYSNVSFRFRGRPPGPPKHRIRWPKIKRLPGPCSPPAGRPAATR